MTTATANTFGILNVVRHLTPTTLAALSVELHAESLNFAETRFLACVDDALNANVGEEEAEQLRMWVRENI